MATDTNLNQLVINKLTKAQYQEAKEAGSIVETELYLLTDAEGKEEVLITIEDIDAICGSTIQGAESATF